jgi:hypothetical protein
MDALVDATRGGDAKMRASAAVNAAAALAVVMDELGADACEEEGRAAPERQSLFVLLNSTCKMSNNGNGSSKTDSTSITEIQSQRIIELESALQAEREAHLQSTREHWHLKNASDRDAFERAMLSVPSTPRVVEVPRDLKWDMEKEELLHHPVFLHRSIVTSALGTKSLWTVTMF